MESLLLLLMVPLGAAALAELFNQDDEHVDGSRTKPEPEPEPEPQPETVILGTEGDDTIWATDPVTEVHAGDGDDFVGIRGSILVEGGNGADLLTNDYSHAGHSTLSGGAGDDTIRGNDGMGFHASSQVDQHSWHVGLSDDVLRGGDGDDIIGFDRADTVTGGAGADVMDGFVNQGHIAHVTDFDPAEDRLRINVDPQESAQGSDPFGRVSVVEVNGDTVIRLGGEDVARIAGRTGLNVGFETNWYSEELGGTVYTVESSSDLELGPNPIHTDLNGNEVDRATLDVVINAYMRFDT